MAQTLQYPFDFSFREESTFDNFHLGDGKNSALLGLLREFPDSTTRFCFLYGPPGCGKTHLLQALCHDSETAVYLPLREMRPHGPDSLKGMQSYDYLVLDDADRIAGLRDWEEALFFLFNALHDRGGRICMAANAAPASLRMSLPDLQSRLQLAVIYELHEPDDALKREILSARAAARGIGLGDEICEYIMGRSRRGMHELLGVLDTLDELSLAQKRRVTVPFLKEIFGW